MPERHAENGGPKGGCPSTVRRFRIGVPADTVIGQQWPDLAEIVGKLPAVRLIGTTELAVFPPDVDAAVRLLAGHGLELDEIPTLFIRDKRPTDVPSPGNQVPGGA